eukprot:6205308-Pleurochrysis_carterae.AAC.3
MSIRTVSLCAFLTFVEAVFRATGFVKQTFSGSNILLLHPHTSRDYMPSVLLARTTALPASLHGTSDSISAFSQGLEALLQVTYRCTCTLAQLTMHLRKGQTCAAA